MQVRIEQRDGDRAGWEGGFFFFLFLEDFTLKIRKAYSLLYHGFSNTPGSE